MGPFSEERQLHRAGAIKELLARNPQMDDYMKSIWQKHAMNISFDEEEYNRRVRSIYSTIKPKHRGWASYE